MSLHNALPRQTPVKLDGIGPESAITISRAVETYDRVPKEVIEASRMLLRSEIRRSQQSGEVLGEVLSHDDAEIMQDVEDGKVLGQPETMYADDKYALAVLPETNQVDLRVAKKMTRSLSRMSRSGDPAERIEAEDALVKLKNAEQNAKSKRKLGWLGARATRRIVPTV